MKDVVELGGTGELPQMFRSMPFQTLLESTQ